MGNGNLPANATAENVVAVVNDLLAALKGGQFPRNVQGVVVNGDGTTAPDIGSPTTPFDAAYIRSIVVGGIAVDLASLAEGSVDVVVENDPTYRWAQGATKGLFILGSGQSGAGGGGQGFSSNSNLFRIEGSRLQRYDTISRRWNNTEAATGGSSGQTGDKSSLTHTRTNTIKETGTPFGGGGGGGILNFNAAFAKPLPNNISYDDEYSEAVNQGVLFAHDFSNNAGGRGGFRKNDREIEEIINGTIYRGQNDPISISGGKGSPGGRQIHSFIIDNIQQGDLFNIQIGAGGLGGATTPLADNSANHANNPAPRVNTAGGNGGTGFCMIIPINEETS